MSTPANVIKLRDEKMLTGELQDALLNVVQADRFDDLTMAQIVGVLEFLKWNLINRADI